MIRPLKRISTMPIDVLVDYIIQINIWMKRARQRQSCYSTKQRGHMRCFQIHTKEQFMIV